MTKRKTKQTTHKIVSKIPRFQEKKLTIEPIFFLVLCFVYFRDFYHILRSATNESKKSIVKRLLSASEHIDGDKKNWFYDGCYVFHNFFVLRNGFDELMSCIFSRLLLFHLVANSPFWFE